MTQLIQRCECWVRKQPCECRLWFSILDQPSWLPTRDNIPISRYTSSCLFSSIPFLHCIAFFTLLLKDQAVKCVTASLPGASNVWCVSCLKSVTRLGPMWPLCRWCLGEASIQWGCYRIHCGNPTMNGSFWEQETAWNKNLPMFTNVYHIWKVKI